MVERPQTEEMSQRRDKCHRRFMTPNLVQLVGVQEGDPKKQKTSQVSQGLQVAGPAWWVKAEGLWHPVSQVAKPAVSRVAQPASWAKAEGQPTRQSARRQTRLSAAPRIAGCQTCCVAGCLTRFVGKGGRPADSAVGETADKAVCGTQMKLPLSSPICDNPKRLRIHSPHFSHSHPPPAQISEWTE